MKFKKLKTKIIIANGELGKNELRMPLIRLLLSSLTLFLSPVGFICVLVGWTSMGMVIILLITSMLSAAIGISAIGTLRTIVPILAKQMR